MKLVQTLVVRDEVDIVDDQIAYHLNAGVDFVIASDHQSVDGTTDVLERYVREGHLRRIAVEGEMRDGPWRTHMPGSRLVPRPGSRRGKLGTWALHGAMEGRRPTAARVDD